MLVLFDDSQFGAVVADDTSEQLTANPLAVCDTVIADGFDTWLLVPENAWPFDRVKLRGPTATLDLERISSGMKRVARDGETSGLSEFTAWKDGGPRARRFWLEAPLEAEHHSRREIALEGLLTMSALRMLHRRMLSRLPPHESWEALPLVGDFD